MDVALRQPNRFRALTQRREVDCQWPPSIERAERAKPVANASEQDRKLGDIRDLIFALELGRGEEFDPHFRNRSRPRIEAQALRLVRSIDALKLRPVQFSKHLNEAGYRIAGDIEDVHIEVECLPWSDHPPVQIPRPKHEGPRWIRQAARTRERLWLENAGVSLRAGDPLQRRPERSAQDIRRIPHRKLDSALS